MVAAEDLAGIRAHLRATPDDRTAWLIYADMVEEGGDGRAAAFGRDELPGKRPDGVRTEWGWALDEPGVTPQGSRCSLPASLWPSLGGGELRVISLWKNYGSEKAALAALHDALLGDA